MPTLKSRRSGKDLRDHPMLREVSNACIMQGCQALDLRAENERLKSLVNIYMVGEEEAKAEIERLRKVSFANIGTMSEAIRNCERWSKSHHELDLAIEQTRAALYE